MTESSLARRVVQESVARPWASGLGAQGPIPNIAIVVILQAISTAIAIGLDMLGFPEATVVIVFVLGVLLTTMLTTGLAYSLASSVISILSYNFFLVYPRFSLAVDGRDYAATIMAMFVLALIVGRVMEALRKSVRLSMDARLIAQREQLRADLLRSVSHDLRTPLTSISGNADMLLDDTMSLSPDMRRAMTQDIYDDATWLSNVVENLLGVTRLEDDDVRLQMSAELVDDVMEEAMRHVSRDASKHVICVKAPDELCLAYMEPHIIVQVIVNLVNNAIAHTPEGSHIMLSARRGQQLVTIFVSDDGPGVPDEEKEQVFEPFYSAPSGSPDARRGVGLGLSLCKAIIDAHGGSIWVEDTPGGGATFAFTLRLEEAF